MSAKASGESARVRGNEREGKCSSLIKLMKLQGGLGNGRGGNGQWATVVSIGERLAAGGEQARGGLPVPVTDREGGNALVTRASERASGAERGRGRLRQPRWSAFKCTADKLMR